MIVIAGQLDDAAELDGLLGSGWCQIWSTTYSTQRLG